MISESAPPVLNGDVAFSLAGDAELDTEDAVRRLYRVWCNERASPELLAPPVELLAEVLELVNCQSVRIEAIRESAPSATTAAFVDCLYQMDLERVKFVLKSLLRCRLAKIERGWAAFQPVWNPHGRAEEQLARLMPVEREYLDAFAANIVSALGEAVLGRLPPDIASLQDPDMLGATPIALPAPLDSHVICRVRQSIGEVVVDLRERSTTSLEAGDIAVLQYQAVRDFVVSGHIELI